MVEYIRECFIRSNQTPLTVSYLGHVSDILAVCGSQLHRVRRLHVENWYIPDTDTSPLLSSDWNSSAPLLDDLQLNGIRLQNGLFGNASPPLQTLRLHQCELVWDSPTIRSSTLTVLDIYCPAEYRTAANLLSILQALPALTSCSLDHCFMPMTPNVVTGSQIHLPCLKRLAVTDEVHDAMVEFFQRLIIPNAILELSDCGEEVAEPDFIERLQWFSGYQDRYWPDIRNLSIKRQSWKQLCAEEVFEVVITTSNKRRFAFTVHALNKNFDFDPAVCASRYLPLDNVESLSLNSVSIEGIISFGPLPRVTTLELKNAGADFIGWAVSSSQEWFPTVTNLRVGDTAYTSFDAFYENQRREP